MTASDPRTWLALALLLCGPFASWSSAQSNQPIYPTYEGFIKNADGSYTLAFGYFSHNADVVTVPPGANNSFAPEPGDRLQSTTFKPGHWRFQCVMVVGPEFDGKMVWTLAYAGSTTGTSQRMLQSNWNLVEGAEDLKKIEYATAKRGVCLNRAPAVRVLGAVGRGAEAAISAPSAQRASLFGSVNDEGLPRSGKLSVSWKQVSGPASVTFEDAASARTHAVFPAPGRYVLELAASDSELSSSTSITVNVK